MLLKTSKTLIDDLLTHACCSFVYALIGTEIYFKSFAKMGVKVVVEEDVKDIRDHIRILNGVINNIAEEIEFARYSENKRKKN